MTGFVVFDYADRHAEGLREMAGWFAEGKLTSCEDIAEGGIERFPRHCCVCSRARTRAS